MKHWVLVFLIIVMAVAVTVYVMCMDVRTESEAAFTVYAGGETYECEGVEVDGVFVTLRGCRGCVEDVRLVGGQDFDEITIEVNQ